MGMEALTDYYARPHSNAFPVANLYGASAGGTTLGLAASAQSADAVANISAPVMPTPEPAPTPTGLHVSPLSYWLGLVLLLAGLMFAVQKSGDDSKFANLRLSFFNVISVTLMAVVGLTLLKPLGVRLRSVRYLDGLGALLVAA